MVLVVHLFFLKIQKLWLIGIAKLSALTLRALKMEIRITLYSGQGMISIRNDDLIALLLL